MSKSASSLVFTMKVVKVIGIFFFVQEFQCLTKLIKLEIYNAYLEYILYLEDELIVNASSFWSIANNFKRSSTISDIMHYNDAELNNPSDTVNTFADLISKVYKPCTASLRLSSSTFHTLLEDVLSIEQSDVSAKLRNLRINFTAGCDNIPSGFAKICFNELVESLTIIFNFSLNSGTFTDLWKQSKISPIFKKG